MSPHAPDFPMDGVGKTTADVKGYIRVRDHAAFPSLKDTDLLLLNGAFTELRDAATAALTLVPPSMIGPPELVHVDQKDTDIPALVTRRAGQGSITWIPWDLGGLYYRLSLPAHAGLFRDIVNRLIPQPLLRTDAHPLVEMTLMHQGSRTLLHLINLSGHSGTGYFEPVAMKDIHVSVADAFQTAKTVRTSGTLPVHHAGGYSGIVIPALRDYELVVLQ